MTARIDRIPVILLTGFLGSGKTTVLQHLLQTEAFADTALVINELGDVAVDQELVRGASETMRLLENGCICCGRSNDLAATLGELFWDRLHRRVPRFARVVIESTGLADPGPVLDTLAADPLVAERFAWQGVVCTVDATEAARTLDKRPESARQVAMADVLLVTKRDRAEPSRIAELQRTLRTLNATAPQHVVANGEVAPALLLEALHGNPGARRATSVPLPGVGHRSRAGAHAHDPGIHTFTVRIDQAVGRAELRAALDAVLARCGRDLLRAKGILALRHEGDVAVQVVGTTCYPLAPLPERTDAACTGHLVFIVAAADRASARAREAEARASIASVLGVTA